MKFEINPRTFYELGFGLFLVLAVVNVGTLIYYFNSSDAFTITRDVIYIIFNLALAAFFNYLKNQIPKTEESMGDDEFDSIIRKITKDDQKKKKKMQSKN